MVGEAELTGDDLDRAVLVAGVERHLCFGRGDDEQVIVSVNLVNDAGLTDPVSGEVASAAVYRDLDFIFAGNNTAQGDCVVDLVRFVVGILTEIDEHTVDIDRVIGVCRDVHDVIVRGGIDREGFIKVDVGVFRGVVSGVT